MNGTDLIGSGDDTELWVMNAFGNLVFNDDDSGPGWLSQANAGALAGQPGGIYLIAYNQFSTIPISSQLNPIIGWSFLKNPSQTGTVQLNLTGAEFVPQVAVAETASVPEPQFAAVRYGVRRIRCSQGAAETFLVVSLSLISARRVISHPTPW
jgi:hypothetical protein